MRDVSGVINLRTDFFGFESTLPLMISPAAMGSKYIVSPDHTSQTDRVLLHSELAHRDGELCIVKGAGRLGMPYAPSNHASIPHLDLSRATLPSQPLFFQLYLHKERWRSAKQISEVKQLGYKAVIVTVDTPFPGKRELDERTGLDDWTIGETSQQGQKVGAKVSAIAQTSA